MAKLNEQQIRFAREYLIDLNATQAAIRAGYSESTARQIGSKLLTNVDIGQLISSGVARVAKKTDITTERILNELARIAFGAIKDVAEWTESGVSFKPSAELSDDAAATISEISESTNEHGGTLKIKQHDKIRALELLGKYQKLFHDGQQANVNVGINIVIKDYSTNDRDQDCIAAEAETIQIED